MTSEIDIEQLGKWSQAREVSTRRGPRMLRKCRPDENFWLCYAASKAALQAAGVSVVKNQEDGKWECLWWKELPPEVLAARSANLEMSRASTADIAIPSPDGCEYMPFQKAGIQFALHVFGELTEQMKPIESRNEQDC